MSLVPFFGRGHLSGFGNVTFDGNITMAAGTTIDATATGARVKCHAGTSVDDGGLQVGGDIHFYRSAANTLHVGTASAAYFIVGTGGIVSAALHQFNGGVVWPETADQGALADSARLFAKDNGAGKTQLVVIFPTGGVRQLDIQP